MTNNWLFTQKFTKILIFQITLRNFRYMLGVFLTTSTQISSPLDTPETVQVNLIFMFYQLFSKNPSRSHKISNRIHIPRKVFYQIQLKSSKSGWTILRYFDFFKNHIRVPPYENFFLVKNLKKKFVTKMIRILITHVK